MPETFDVVFRGGGIKGVAFVGALEKLVAGKHATRRLVGSSAGAIFATSWAAGYTPAEMLKKVGERRDGKLVFASFLATARRPEWVPELLWGPLTGTMNTMIRRAAKLIPKVDPDKAEGWGAKSLALTIGGAVCDDQPFRDWMGDVLKDKGIDPVMPLKAFHAAINKARPQQLSLIAADITAQNALVLNERTAPDLPILEAVRMSMGIPFVWKEVAWKEAWGFYHGRDIAGHDVVDGGLLTNFPVRFLLDPHYSKAGEVLGPPPAGAAATVGLLLDNAKVIPDLPDVREDEYLVEAMPVVRLASRLLDTMLDAWDKDTLRQSAPAGNEDAFLCRIGTRGIGALDFDLADDRLAALVNAGRCGMQEFLDRRKK